MTVNPIYELLVEALDCADRLALGDGSRWLADAVSSAHEVIELPDWLPQFTALVEAMSGQPVKPNSPKPYLPRCNPRPVIIPDNENNLEFCRR